MFSLKDNYNYEEKSILVKCLDWASSPCRELIGGKTVCLITETKAIEPDKLYLFLKVGALALLTFALPKIGVIIALSSLASFGFKVLFVTYSSEIEKINREFEKLDLIKQFDRANATHNDAEVIKLYEANSFISAKEDAKAIYTQAQTKEAARINELKKNGIMAQFNTASVNKNYAEVIKLYEANSFISARKDAQAIYTQALFGEAARIDDLKKDDILARFNLANTDKNYAEVIKLYGAHPFISEKIDPQATIYTQALFGEAVRTSNHEEVFRLYQKHECVREVLDFQKEYALTITKVFRFRKSMSLIDAAKLLVLITDQTLVVDTFSKLICDYASFSDAKCPLKEKELIDIFKVTLGLESDQIEACCVSVFEKCKFKKKIEMQNATQKDLFQILVIEEIISILEEIPNRKKTERTSWHGVVTYLKNEVPALRKFLEDMFILETSIKGLEEIFRIKKIGTKDLRSELLKLQKTLHPITIKLGFQQLLMNDLLDEMYLLLLENINLGTVQSKTSHQDKISQISRLLFANSPYKKSNRKRIGFDIESYYARLGRRLILNCLNIIKGSLGCSIR